MSDLQLGYRILGRSGLRVSELCLGTMSFGDQWGFGANESVSHQILDSYAAMGGNFLDTANKYHGGQTEEICGRWLADKRHRFVVATKYTLSMDPADPNTAGNHRKNLVRSVEQSLRRLGTDYIDLLWVHAWDRLTPIDETMRALDDVVRSGKVLYVGISDAPAWVVSASNMLADLRGWSPFVALQIEYSLIERTPERDLLPMADHFDLAVLAWGPIGGGVLTGKYTRGDTSAMDSLRQSGNVARGRTSERALAIAREVDAVADELGVTSTQVAVAWVGGQRYRYLPILGARTIAQLEDSMAGAAVRLTDAQRARLDAASAITLGFPHQFLASDAVTALVRGEQHARITAPPGPRRGH